MLHGQGQLHAGCSSSHHQQTQWRAYKDEDYKEENVRQDERREKKN